LIINGAARDRGHTRRIAVKSVLIALAAALALTSLEASAQQYPERPVRLIVTFPPGGGADLLARVVGKQLSERWKESVVVDNRGGGDGAIGAAIAARTEPDGHTVLMIISTHTVLPHIKTNLQYDLVKDFAPIVRIAEAPNAVVVQPSFPAKTISELIEVAKKEPGKLNYPGSGLGGPAHLAGVLFDRMAGTKMTFIPYRGTGPSLVALMGGQVHVMFPAITGALPHVRAGKLRALSVTSEKRSALLPDVPTVAETLDGYVFVGWYGLVARSGTPRHAINRIYADTAGLVNDAEVRPVLANAGLSPAILNPQQFGAYINQELKSAARLVADAGLEKQ
jgi:tripartite-type tricarboxylate transporter receptor subunit TctC